MRNEKGRQETAQEKVANTCSFSHSLRVVFCYTVYWSSPFELSKSLVVQSCGRSAEHPSDGSVDGCEIQSFNHICIS